MRPGNSSATCANASPGSSAATAHARRSIKSDPQRSKSAQQRRIKAANDALQNAGPLPAKDRRARLFDVDVQFKTHLDLLALGTERAARDGIFAVRVRGDRALLVTDI